MNIFESLENLNVSEECFNDIIGIVEDLLSEDVDDIKKRIEKKYGKAKGYLDSYYDTRNKSAKLIDKLDLAREREEEKAAERANYKKLRVSPKIDDWIDNSKTVDRVAKGQGKEKSKLIIKRYSRNKGSFYPSSNKYILRGDNQQFTGSKPPSDTLGSYKKAEEKSIARHNNKNK